ncbi:MAG: hypothetical protein GX558_10215 [Clostridiales bacterium]|nr:hypothetical protein [Clostridiales bacterium]
MKILLDARQREELNAKLGRDEDAQAEGEGYVLDLYDAQPPVSMELQVEGDGALLLAALELKYDEELDGYYPGEKIRDAALLGQLLKRYIGQ